MIGDLLHYAAGRGDAGTSRDHSQADPDLERQLQYLRDTGFAPLLQRAVSDRVLSVPAAWSETLLAESLTAQVRHGALVDAAIDVLDACDHLGVPLTVLKGISISDQFYPAPHLRPMGDVDVLGQFSYLDVWNHDRFLSKLQREPFTDDDARALSEFGI